jgi:hypothetical protein
LYWFLLIYRISWKPLTLNQLMVLHWLNNKLLKAVVLLVALASDYIVIDNIKSSLTLSLITQNGNESWEASLEEQPLQ